MKKSELRRLVEQRVDEAWYNNKDDFFKGVGKVTTAGVLGTAALTGGAYALDKGLEQQERYEQQLNQEAAKNMYGSEYHYEQWCQDHELDPNSQKARQFYDSWLEDELNESNIRYLVRRAIVESYVRRKLNESNLYHDGVDTSDLTVHTEPLNDDGYAEWEATCDNGWYTFTGTYNGYDLELDSIIAGHSGHGHQVDVDGEALQWFDENLRDAIVARIENEI